MDIACVNFTRRSRLRLDTNVSVLWTSPSRVPSNVSNWPFLGLNFHPIKFTVDLRHQNGICRRSSPACLQRGKIFLGPDRTPFHVIAWTLTIDCLQFQISSTIFKIASLLQYILKDIDQA